MTRYAVGDVQGCYDSLKRLLRKIRFDAAEDTLWLVGDLVNRGPKSLEVLRWAKAQGDRVVAVLGNHDLHLLAAVAGHRTKNSDTLGRVLDAPDRTQLIRWLRHRPLLHRKGEWVMVHAGLHPTWSVKKAQRLAGEVEERLRGRRWQTLFERPLARAPDWSDDLEGVERLAAITRVLCSVRTVRPDHTLCDEYAGPPEYAPRGCVPWFQARKRGWKDHRFVFGHWAALGLRSGVHYMAIDSGCVWGRSLTAVRLKDCRVYQVSAVE